MLPKKAPNSKIEEIEEIDLKKYGRVTEPSDKYVLKYFKNLGVGKPTERKLKIVKLYLIKFILHEYDYFGFTTWENSQAYDTAIKEPIYQKLVNGSCYIDN